MTIRRYNISKTYRNDLEYQKEFSLRTVINIQMIEKLKKYVMINNYEDNLLQIFWSFYFFIMFDRTFWKSAVNL